MRDFLEVMEEGEKLGRSLSQRSRGIANFKEKLEKFVGLLTNVNGYSARKRAMLMEEAEGTSDFPILFGTVLERTLLGRYQTAKPDWRNYIKVGTQNDFRSNNIIGLFGLESELEEVKERGEYKADKLQDGKVANKLKKYGRKFPLSWESLINDDLGAFSDAADRLAAAALNTEILNATRLIFGSGATGFATTCIDDAITHPIDGATFDNRETYVLSADNIGDAVTKIRKRKTADGNPIIVTRFHLVVPPDLEIPALKALSSAALITTALGSTAAAAVQTSENVIAKLPITLHVNEFIPLVATSGTVGTTCWALLAEGGPASRAVQMNFLRGHESPEVVQKSSNKMSAGGGEQSPLEGDFDSDTAQWRIRHIMGGTQIDPRLAHGSTGQ